MGCLLPKPVLQITKHDPLRGWWIDKHSQYRKAASVVPVCFSVLCKSLCGDCGGGLVAKLCLTLATPWTIIVQQASLSMGFSRQPYWRGLPFPSPGDLPDPGIEPGSPALQADSLPTELWRKPMEIITLINERLVNHQAIAFPPTLGVWKALLALLCLMLLSPDLPCRDYKPLWSCGLIANLGCVQKSLQRLQSQNWERLSLWSPLAQLLMGLGGWQQHMPFQILLIYSLDVVHTPWYSAFCHLWSQAAKPSSIYCVHATCRDRQGGLLNSFILFWFLFLFSFFHGHTVWQRLEQEICVLTLGQILFHARCGPASWPLWLPVFSAKSRRTLPVLSFLAYLSQSGCSSPREEFICNLNGDKDSYMHVE